MKAVELMEAIEPSPVLHRDCTLCSTGCCISTRQWVSSLLVFPGLLWLFKYLELLAFSVWVGLMLRPLSASPLVFLFFIPSFHFLSCLLPFISIFLSGHNVSVSSCLLASLSLFVYLIHIYVASLSCHIPSCPVSSINLQWTLPAFDLCLWVETSCLHMNNHGCVCKRDTYSGW